MTRPTPRRIATRALRALGAALAALAAQGCAREAPATVRNAVLICLDTVRADSFELARSLEPAEQRAYWERAAWLIRARSPAPWTVPAVASAFTGLRPEKHGAGSFSEKIANIREIPRGLDRATPALAEHLRSQGFETIGLFAHPWLEYVNLGRGFETWTLLDGPGSRLRVVQEMDRWLARRDPARRFLLYLHLMEAHEHPFLSHAERRNRMATLTPGQRAGFLARAPGRVCENRPSGLCRQYLTYSASILLLRATVTGMLDALERHGVLDETVVLLFSDHGEEFLDHERQEAEEAIDPRERYGLGHGHTLFEELLRIPLFVWHPGLAPGPREAPASLLDVAPTLLDWLGVPALPGDGQSLRPALEGGAFDPERPLFASALAYGPQRQAVTRGRWKAIAGDGLPSRFYDLAEDPREERPRGDPGGLAELLAAHRAQAPDTAGEPVELDADSARALHALGYLEGAGPE